MSVLDLVADRLEQEERDADYLDDPVGWARDRLGVHLWSKQREIARSVVENRFTAVQSAAGVGKALELGTVLPTPTGWTTMGEVQVGDYLLDEEGKPALVTAISPIQHRPTFRVTFNDGTALVASDDHQWQVLDRHLMSYHRVTDWRDHWALTVSRTTAELAANPATPRGQSRWYVPTARPLAGNATRLAVGPYTLGAWLGDGVSANVGITCSFADAPETLGHIEAEGYVTRERPSQRQENSSTWGILELKAKLRALGVLGRKRIPAEALRADVDTRLALLQGLMDTDGFVSTGQSVGIDLCDEQLSADVYELVVSLGWRAFRSTKPAKVSGRIVGTVYRLQFRPDLPVFRLQRKAERLGLPVGQASRHTVRTIVSIEPVETVPTKCVMVDSSSHLYLAGESMIPTHNTYLAAVLALWYGTVHSLDDVKVVTTAPTADQVSLLLWGEIRQQFNRVANDDTRANLPGRMLLNDRWVNDATGWVGGYGRKPPDHSQSAFQGAHAGHMLVIVDEAGGIEAPLWAAIRAITTNEDARILAIGNPDRAASEFAKMCRPGTSWNSFKISAFDTPRFTGEQVPDELLTHLPSVASVETARNDWGESSALYRAKVLGEFSDDADGLIPYSWVIAAQERWRNYWPSLPEGHSPPGRAMWSCDVATTGADQTVIVRKQGPVFYELERWNFNEDVLEVAGLLGDRVRSVPGAHGVIDANGAGNGAYAALRRQGLPVRAYVGSKKTERVDSTGTVRFERVRSAAWWAMREALNPALGATLCLPPDDMLARDLTTPNYKIGVNGKVQVEERAATQRRLGRSPDAGDCCVMALWQDGAPALDLIEGESAERNRAPRVRKWGEFDTADAAGARREPDREVRRPRVRR